MIFVTDVIFIIVWIQRTHAVEVTQSGDLGFRIARTIGLRYATSCKASHINMLRANPPKLLAQPFLWLQYMLTPYTEKDKEGFKRSKWFVEQGSGK